MLEHLLLSPLAIGFDVEIWQAIRQNDIVGIACLLALTWMSFHSIYWIFRKAAEIRAADIESKEFIAECMEDHKSLHEIFKATAEYPASPLASLLREAYTEYEMEARTGTMERLPLEQRVQLGKTSVESALERTIAAEIRRLESRLSSLATASTIAPFIGLFGTVWGVLAAFQALGREGSAGLSTLAPGISTALMTTIFGLMVAIPAAWAYNKLSSTVLKLESQMDSFAHELSNVFQKHLLKQGNE